MASANGHLEIAEFLIDKKIELNMQNESGNTALRNLLFLLTFFFLKHFL